MGKFTAYKLPLKSLGVGTHEFDFHLDKTFFENMENEDVRDADLSVNVRVGYNGDFYDLDLDVSGDIVIGCDRCLDDLTFPIDADYHIVVKYGEDYNDDNDEVLIIPDSDATLNVAYMIHDTVVLAIPIKHVHPAGKCNRQMSELLKKHQATISGDDAEYENEIIDEIDDCEADDAGVVDPRWNALRKLSSSDDNN